MISLFYSYLLGAISIIAALHALLTKRDSKSALAWITLCLVVPLFGALLYIVFGVNRVNVQAQRSYQPRTEEDPSKSLNEPPGTHFRPFSLVGEEVTGKGLRSCDDIQILENGEELYPAMLADINSARDRVYCSTYIFQNDQTGDEFVNAFVAAQNRGVDVRIIIDGLGAIAYGPRIGGKLLGKKLNFKQFNPITILPPSLHINMRNHRKVMVVDGDVAYTGGQNIGERHLIEKSDNPKRTADLHFRLSGKIVDEFERTFIKDWNYCSGVVNKTAFTPSNTNRNQSDIWTRLILDGPNENLDKLNELLVGVLSSAKQRIWLMTPYFLPGLDLIGALVGARLRGVDVKIIVPEITNVYMTHWATQHNLSFILARELNVLLQPAPFVHTKAILIDDNYSLIGSANLDPRSLRLNFELGVEIFSEQFNAELSSYFDTKLKSAYPLTREKLQARPAWIRIRDALAWLFSPYL